LAETLIEISRILYLWFKSSPVKLPRPHKTQDSYRTAQPVFHLPWSTDGNLPGIFRNTFGPKARGGSCSIPIIGKIVGAKSEQVMSFFFANSHTLSCFVKGIITVKLQSTPRSDDRTEDPALLDNSLHLV
jgi:hypothetical protein